MGSFNKFMFGEPGGYEQISNLSPQQQQLFTQLMQAMQGQGAGGAYGTAADYYRDLLSDDSNTFNKMMQPEMRQFNEQIMPGLSEQFAGMGAGGLSSSGFRNAATGAATDLSERLGALRMQLRQQGAQGLMGMGQQAMQPNMTNVYNPGTGGFMELAGPALGAAGTAFAGPMGAAAGNAFGNWLSGYGKKQSMAGGSSPISGGSSGAVGGGIR